MTESTLHVVVLAAGKGSRMRSTMPKVLHQLAGQSLLEHVLNSALQLDPAHLHVVVGHAKEQVISAFETHPAAHKISWVEQRQQLGTGHAVAQALPAIPDHAQVLMLTADVPLIAASTLSSLCNSMAQFSLALLTAKVEQPFGLGRITRDGAGAITGIVEEKDASKAQREINEINSGILCARAAPLKKWLQAVDNSNAQQEYYLTDIVALAVADGEPITAQHPQHNHEVVGINSRAQLAEAEAHYRAIQAHRLMEAGVTLRDPARIDLRGTVEVGQDSVIDVNVVIQDTQIGRNVQIGPNCVIASSRIGDDVVIHANTVIDSAQIDDAVNVGPFARIRPGTQLAAGVRIGNFVETKNAQLATGAKVNHLSYVGDATVGANTNIGAGVITCNYDGANKHKTQIGADVFVGSDSQLVAPVTIADGATIGAGSTITSNVAADQLAISRAKQRTLDGWQRPQKNPEKK